MKNIKIEDLIQYFDNKLRQTDADHIGTFSGTGPKYPMAVVYLGNKSAEVHKKLSVMINRIWPPYKKELCFFGVTREKTFFQMNEADKVQELDSRDLQAKINYLFGTTTHFADRNRMMVYFILDTTEIVSVDEMKRWEEIMAWTSGEIKADGQMKMLLTLLNEDFEHLNEAKVIRNEIGESMYASPRTMAADSVFMISNRRNDNAIISDWYECCKILADFIVLSDGFYAEITTQLFSTDVKTAGYSLVEKPSQQIAQVVVSSMIEHLNSYRRKKDTVEILEDEKLDEKLGITREGTVQILDEYGEKELVPLLPSPEQLECFPRNTGEDIPDVSRMSEREFNELTMNAWESYLEKIIGKAEQMISEGTALKDQWKKQYRTQLSGYFSADELIALSESEVTIRKRFRNMTEPGSMDTVLNAAKNKLKYKLSMNETLTNFFIEALKEEGERGKELIQAWGELVSTLNQLFQVEDTNLSDFYRKKVQKFFDIHGNDIGKRFNQLGSVEELESFLKELVETILQSETIFHAPFEEELQKRLDAASNPIDSRSYIRSKLTGDEIKTYLRVSFALQETALSAILLKKNTPLHKNLISNLSEMIYYYDTGCGDGAEALVIYQVEVSNLVS